MNFTAILAILELKGIITHEQAEKLVEHLNNKPQPTELREALPQIKEILGIQDKTIVEQATAKTDTKKNVDV